MNGEIKRYVSLNSPVNVETLKTIFGEFPIQEVRGHILLKSKSKGLAYFKSRQYPKKNVAQILKSTKGKFFGLVVNGEIYNGQICAKDIFTNTGTFKLKNGKKDVVKKTIDLAEINQITFKSKSYKF